MEKIRLCIRSRVILAVVFLISNNSSAFAVVNGAGAELFRYNVGIGTAGMTPAGKLEVDGSVYVMSGNIGIGTTVSHASLEISNTAGFTSQYDNGNSGAAATINWANGNKQKITLTANTTLTFTAPGVVGNLMLQLNQDATGGRTVTWPAAVKWPGGNAPSPTGTASAVDMVSFFYNGTLYYGNASMDYK